MTGESLKSVLPRNHTAPWGRRLSEQTGSPNLVCAPPIERWSQVIGALGVSCAVAKSARRGTKNIQAADISTGKLYRLY